MTLHDTIACSECGYNRVEVTDKEGDWIRVECLRSECGHAADRMTSAGHRDLTTQP